MGTGKSSVGRLVAVALKRPFIDTDHLIEEREGRPVSEIFADRGEAYFRERERSVIAEEAARRGAVITVGGGAVLDPDNVTALKKSGLLICLQASTEVILERVGAESHRPLLEDGDKGERIRSLLESRKPFYDALPYQVDTTRLTQEETAHKVLDLYRVAHDMNSLLVF